jgi:hypothetical protein
VSSGIWSWFRLVQCLTGHSPFRRHHVPGTKPILVSAAVATAGLVLPGRAKLMAIGFGILLHLRCAQPGRPVDAVTWRAIVPWAAIFSRAQRYGRARAVHSE